MRSTLGRRFARHDLLNPPLVGAVVSLLVSALTALVAPWPAPQFHDEFSYLLAGDTFARGRLANAAHPLWRFFETFQVLSQPTYSSKYPPGQGLVLAIGQAVFGEPIVGVWISTALASAAVGWMLGGALPRRWAAIGAAMAAMHPMVLDWNWSFWGGSVAMAGGALLVGAAIRLLRSWRARLGVIAGIGMTVLANSRPLEGAILSAACVVIVLFAMMRGAKPQTALKVAAATISVLLVNFLWMGFYNARVTGNFLQMPYALYEKQYAPTRPLAWMPPPATLPVYRHAPMREFYIDWELPNYQRQRTAAGFAASAAGKLWDLVRAYGRAPTIAMALAGLPLAWRRARAVRLAAAASIVCVLNALPVLTFFPHYTAPVASAIFLVVVAGLFALRRSAWGRALIAIVIAGQIAAAGWWVWQRANREPSWNNLREAMIAERTGSGRKYLIFVQPAEGYYVHNEWVYNGAEIDSQAVVWARDMGSENRKLVEYYRSLGQQREAQVMTIGSAGIQFRPYRAP